jgi:hypothetical protein
MTIVILPFLSTTRYDLPCLSFNIIQRSDGRRSITAMGHLIPNVGHLKRTAHANISCD